MHNTIVLASNNAHKLGEIREMLSPLGIEVKSLAELGISVDPEENGVSFEENASIKARAVHDIVALPVIADDSGLCVDALDGRPGVYSARYAPDGRFCEHLLEEMQGIPIEQRSAHFVTAMVFLDEDGTETVCRGEVHGTIGLQARGEHGFGYDPVFVYGGKSFAELSPEEKNAVSHRANALKDLYALLEERSQTC